MQIDDFRKTLIEFLDETGMSKNQLASSAGVSQSQISDWSNGKGKRFTEKSKKVVNFIEDYRNSSNQRIPENIESAVRTLLNGDKSRTDALENILNSLRGAFT